MIKTYVFIVFKGAQGHNHFIAYRIVCERSPMKKKQA